MFELNFNRLMRPHIGNSRILLMGCGTPENLLERNFLTRINTIDFLELGPQEALSELFKKPESQLRLSIFIGPPVEGKTALQPQSFVLSMLPAGCACVYSAYHTGGRVAFTYKSLWGQEESISELPDSEGYWRYIHRRIIEIFQKQGGYTIP